MKVYLAGPMRGYLLDNFPEFTVATARIRERGHEVFSPAEHDIKMGYDPVNPPAWFDIREALRADLEWVCLHADAVVLLHGWRHSKGAMAEVHTARALGIPAYELADFLMERYSEVEV